MTALLLMAADGFAVFELSCLLDLSSVRRIGGGVN